MVNGPYGTLPVPVRGYVIDYASGKLKATFAPDGGLHNPHDIVVSPDGSSVYVAEINPYKVHKFEHEQAKVDVVVKPNVTHAKPTAVVGEYLSYLMDTW